MFTEFAKFNHLELPGLYFVLRGHGLLFIMISRDNGIPLVRRKEGMIMAYPWSGEKKS